MTLRDSATGQRTTLLRVAAATWLLLVSAVLLVDHMALSGLAEQAQAFAPTAQVSLLESRVDGLSHRIEQRDTQPAALPQARYEQDTAALDQRLAAIELAQAYYAATDALHALETRVTRLEARPVSRQPKLPAPRPSQPVAAQPKPVEPSFRLIGVELRAGEHFVSVMPANGTGLADVRLLRAGESEGGWRLDGIERDGAVFRQGRDPQAAHPAQIRRPTPMVPRHLTPPLLVALLAASAMQAALAQPTGATTAARTAPSREAPAAIARSDEQRAQDWGLRTDEWTRYRELMQGPLGVYSPSLDPLTALGIEARSDEERRRYAELQVRAEARRVEKTLAYQRAYDAAWQRIAPGMARVNLPGAKPTGAGTTIASGTDRTAVFVKDGCTACDQAVQRLQASGAEFDVYVVGSRTDDARIREWARRARIDPAKVRARHITLNHDGGRWLSLGLQGELPAVVRQVGGQWQRQ